MYEELMPIWKARCKSATKHNYFTNWPIELDARKLSYKYIYRYDLNGVALQDCLVNGIMLFTWEQGISE